MVVKAPKVLRDGGIKGKGVTALEIGIGLRLRTLSFEPSIETPRRGFARNEPRLQIVVPAGARKGLSKPLDRHAVIGKCRRRSRTILSVRTCLAIAHG